MITTKKPLDKKSKILLLNILKQGYITLEQVNELSVFLEFNVNIDYSKLSDSAIRELLNAEIKDEKQ